MVKKVKMNPKEIYFSVQNTIMFRKNEKKKIKKISLHKTPLWYRATNLGPRVGQKSKNESEGQLCYRATNTDPWIGQKSKNESEGSLCYRATNTDPRVGQKSNPDSELYFAV